MKGRGGRRASKPHLSTAGLQAAFMLLHTSEEQGAVHPEVDVLSCRSTSLNTYKQNHLGKNPPPRRIKLLGDIPHTCSDSAAALFWP